MGFLEEATRGAGDARGGHSSPSARSKHKRAYERPSPADELQPPGDKRPEGRCASLAPREAARRLETQAEPRSQQALKVMLRSADGTPLALKVG